MSEYIAKCNEVVGISGKTLIVPDYIDTSKEIVRCRDCEHATISTIGVCKYCEMWVLPDVDGYGCDSQVNLPLDFFCAYGKRKEGGDE